MAGFTFGTNLGSAGGGGFKFSTPTPTPTTSAPAISAASPGFSFSAASPSSTGTGFPLTTPAVPALGTPSFSFNLNPSNSVSSTTTTTGSSLFNLGGNTGAKLPSAPVLGAPATSATTFSFATPPSTSFSFTMPPSTSLTAPQPAAKNPLQTESLVSSQAGIAATSAAPSTSFPGFGLGIKPSTAITSPAPLNLNASPSVSAAVQPISATPASSLGPTATLSTSTTTTSFGASGAGGATNLSMRQLEERLNKWLVELKEQEERFVRQAVHVNAWDQILQNGHDQVQTLKDTLHTVKSDQSRLEAEIDFIRGQQEELERLLDPLESATNANPATQLHQGDRQRDNMYYLAQSLDGQLRQMTDDLGKVIEHLNTNSGSWQPNDPVTLVARILSAHMDTLKWVDQNTTILSQKMDEVSRVATNTGKRG